MRFEDLQKAMIAAMKNHEAERKDVISLLVANVKKAAIDAGTRDDIPEEMVDAAILKELKTTKEQIDTCPASREDLLTQYRFKLSVVEEFAPKMLSAEEVEAILKEKFAEVIATKNKGQIMKAVMQELKGKADGKVINEVVTKLCS
ncbi:MAG: GatB/YqeY domain-containing protein [Firmicutes bacterium]|nr:GatB/YqeY domain-containing protein [Bacillota bacterium]